MSGCDESCEGNQRSKQTDTEGSAWGPRSEGSEEGPPGGGRACAEVLPREGAERVRSNSKTFLFQIIT